MSGKNKRSVAWYTSTYSTILDSPEYEQLSLHAAAAWWALKHCPENNQLGIFVFFNDQVRCRSKIPPEHVQDALLELEAGRWTRMEGRWIWLRNHLKFDPHYNPDNPNQVTGLIRKIESMPRTALVAEFVAYYKNVKHPETGTPYLPASYEYKFDAGRDGMGMAPPIPPPMVPRRHRKGTPKAPPCHPDPVAVTETDTESKPEQHSGAGAPGGSRVGGAEASPEKPVDRKTWLSLYGEAWKARWGGESEPPWGEMAANFGPSEKQLGQGELWKRWVRFLHAAERAEWARPSRFVQGLGQWADHGSPGMGKAPPGTTAIARAGPQRAPALTTAGEKSIAAGMRYLERRRVAGGGG